MNIDITAYVEYVEDTDILCPNCNLEFKNKRALGSHVAFKRGKCTEVLSQCSNSELKNVAAIPSSQAEPIHSTDAPKEIPTMSVASISLAETPTSDSPSTSTTVDTS